MTKDGPTVDHMQTGKTECADPKDCARLIMAATERHFLFATLSRAELHALITEHIQRTVNIAVADATAKYRN